MSTHKPEPILYLSDARGIYIPRDFATDTRRDCITGLADDVLPILEAGPEHEWYWDAWTDVENNARVTDPTTGTVYTVFQDGDCWLIPVGMEWDDAAEFFYWPDADEEG